ncbi:MAG: hypothetical protein QXJ97_13475 [Desulfurococcaceae archaeon]
MRWITGGKAWRTGIPPMNISIEAFPRESLVLSLTRGKPHNGVRGDHAKGRRPRKLE